MEKNRFENSGDFKAVIGNVLKQMAIRPETQIIIREEKIIETVCQKIVTKEVQMQKERMEI